MTTGEWKPIRLVHNGTPLTHLFFADDLLLAEASCDQARVMNSLLDMFCDSFRAKVNKSKTQVYFSKNVVVGEKKIVSILGFSVMENLGKYLGMPFLHLRLSKRTHQDIIDKVERRFFGCNASRLSLVGRIILA